jgi:hypothetical protein
VDPPTPSDDLGDLALRLAGTSRNGALRYAVSVQKAVDACDVVVGQVLAHVGPVPDDRRYAITTTGAAIGFPGHVGSRG